MKSDNGEKCPESYNDCTCVCHKMPGVRHIRACCYPKVKDFKVLEKDKKEAVLQETGF